MPFGHMYPPTTHFVDAMSKKSDPQTPFKVVIVGAGVAGLSVAAFLRQRTSFRVQVLERSDVTLEADPDTDYGITIAANGAAVLAELGMKDAPAELAGCEMSQVRETNTITLGTHRDTLGSSIDCEIPLHR